MKTFMPGWKLYIYIKAIGRAFWVWSHLPFVSLPRLLKRLEEKYGCRHARSQREIDEIARITNRVCRWKLFLIRNNCLKKSIVTYSMLLEAGMRGLAINIGIRKEKEKLSGHGWLTLHGDTYLEDGVSVSPYLVMYRYGNMDE